MSSDDQYVLTYMMNTKEKKKLSGFWRSKISQIKGHKTRHLNKAYPREELDLDIPNLKMDSCLIPGSLHLCFEFKVSNVKSTFMNNLSRLLIKRF